MGCVLSAPLRTSSYRVFLSSGSDVVALRDRTDRLCMIATNVLSRNNQLVRLEVDRWENTPPHRAASDHLNDEFVERALQSNIVIALLQHELRPGTLEELEAVLGRGGIEVAVCCFASDQPRSPELLAFLATWKERMLYKEIDAPDSDEAWLELTRLVMNLMVEALLDSTRSESYHDVY